MAQRIDIDGTVRAALLAGLALAACILTAVCAPASAAGVASETVASFDETRVGETRTIPAFFVAERLPADAGEPLGTAALEGEDAAEFAIVSDACSGVTLTSACRVGVAFQPASPGIKLAVLRVDGANGSALVPLRGTAFAAGRRIAIEPPEGLTFTGASAGVLSAPQRARVVNTGDLPARPAVRVLGGSEGFLLANGTCDGRELQPGADCAVDVRAIARVRADGVLAADCDPACGAAAVPLAAFPAPAPPPSAPNLHDNLFWSVALLRARPAAGRIRLAVYTSLPARLVVRVFRNGVRIWGGAVHFGPGTLRSSARLALEPGRRYTVTVRAIRGAAVKRLRRIVRAPPRA